MSRRTFNGRHYITGEPIAIQCNNGIITAVAPNPGTEATSNLWVAPSLLDLQVNGFGGIDFQQDDLTTEELLTATLALRSAGCRRWLLTLITDDWPVLLARLKHLKKLRDASTELRAAIVGWHIEGPFLSDEPGFCGAHNPRMMRDASTDAIRQLRTTTGNDPLLLTIAAERPGALEAIATATSLGIKVSLGHTNASADILAQAVDRGATGFTHLGNACPRELDRYDNIIWRVLDQSNLTVSLIPDGIHVSPALFRMVHRVKPIEKIFYTTDAMSAAGMPPGRYCLGHLELEVGADQVVRHPGRTHFAGSALRPIDGVRRAAEMLGISWPESWRRFSERPARFMGLGSGLAVGQPAEICLIQTSEDGKITGLQPN